MKTFETEKNNIPDGATHYRNECGMYKFIWFQFSGNGFMVLDCYGDWVDISSNVIKSMGFIDPIPSATTETPEEKEALDLIDTAPQQLESLNLMEKAIEHLGWKNGDECRYNDINWLFCGFHPVNGLAIVSNNDEPSSHQIITVDVELLSKPETPEAKKEREELEAAYDLYCHVSKKANRGTYTFEQFCDESLTDHKIDYLAIVRKTNYRKGE